jgi:hypothetical protein
MQVNCKLPTGSGDEYGEYAGDFVSSVVGKFLPELTCVCDLTSLKESIAICCWNAWFRVSEVFACKSRQLAQLATDKEDSEL